MRRLNKLLVPTLALVLTLSIALPVLAAVNDTGFSDVDASARPAISGSISNMEQYDVIFLGYPIWWGQAPKIIYTFLESYDLGGKTIVPFCTSGSSGIGSSASNLHSLASSATWLNGQRFSGGASRSTVESWVNGLGLTLTPAA